MKAIFITARTNSTRLPGKMLTKVFKKRVICHDIERAKRINKHVNTKKLIVLCTTTNPIDDKLCRIAKNNRIMVFRGNEEDKLSRWLGAAKKFNVEFFVTFDGDDLLCDPELIAIAFAQYHRTKADFIEAPNVPCGAFTYGIKTKALQKVCDMKYTTDTEMMAGYFKSGMFNVEQLQDIPAVFQRPEIRMTLDYPEDLKFFRKIFEDFGYGPPLRVVIEYLDRNPNVIKINQHLQKDWAENQQKRMNLVYKPV